VFDYCIERMLIEVIVCGESKERVLVLEGTLFVVEKTFIKRDSQCEVP
jgi:hypothetical protein